MLEPVGVVLEHTELRGRLLLDVLRRSVHRLVGPSVVRVRHLLKVLAPPAALPGDSSGQVLLQGLDAPVHHGNGVAVLGPVQRGKLVAQVCRDHKVLVVPRQLLCGALGGPAHRLGVLVLGGQRDVVGPSTAGPRPSCLPRPPLCCRPPGLRPGSGGRLGRPGAWKCAPKCSLSTGVVDVVGLGHVHHEVGGCAEPVPAGEEELSAGGQVVGARNVPRVRSQGQGVAVHARCASGVRGQDHAAAAAGADRPV